MHRNNYSITAPPAFILVYLSKKITLLQLLGLCVILTLIPK